MRIFLLVSFHWILVQAFRPTAIASRRSFHTTLRESEFGLTDIERYIQAEYPSFASFLSTSEEALKAIRDPAAGCTIFCPNEQAFANLGGSKLEQLSDPRNLESATKIINYHVVNEPVTGEELYDSGGVITLGGTVDVSRTVTGGFFGIGGQEDGSVNLNGAQVLQSIIIEGGILFEVDSFISPQLLWRYMDQLRIPGSK